LVFLLLCIPKEARYLAPLWPAFAYLQCMALERIARARASAATALLAALFLACSVELNHLEQPFYREHLPRRLAETIRAFTRTSSVVFLKPMTALYPAENEFHWSDSAYYVYHWGVPAYVFHAGRLARYAGRSVSFERRGFPVPDDPEMLAAEGEAMIVPADRIYTAEALPPVMLPVHMFRWEKQAGDSTINLIRADIPLAEAR
ncbi:MAG: hypothetical protein AAB229_00005, partial [Candidatus Hydrogenedentota bacterium]